MQKGSGYILSSISFQQFTVSTAINDMVVMCTNLWCNNPKANFFLGAILFYLDISFIFNKNSCLLCALCVIVNEFSLLSPKYTVHKPFWNKKVCTKFINVIIENILSHRSGAKSTLCNVAMKDFLLLSHIFI